MMMPDAPEKTGVPRDENGRFIKGTSGNPAGRPKGSVDGIVSLRRLIGDVADEMVASGEIRGFFDAIRKDKKAGVLWMLKHVFEPFLRNVDRSAAVSVDLDIRVGDDREAPESYADLVKNGPSTDSRAASEPRRSE